MMQQFFFLSHVPPNSLQSFFPPANFWQIEPSFLTIPHTPLSAATNTPILEMIVLAVTVIIRFFTDIIYTNCEFSCNLRVSASQELDFKQWCWYCLVDCRLSWWREKTNNKCFVALAALCFIEGEISLLFWVWFCLHLCTMRLLFFVRHSWQMLGHKIHSRESSFALGTTSLNAGESSQVPWNTL